MPGGGLGGGLTVAVTIRRAGLVAVAIGRQEPDFAKFPVHRGLEGLEQAGAFRFRLGEIAQVGFEGEGLLMSRIAGQTDLLTIVCFKGECHTSAGKRRLRPGNAG